jgi:predicted RNase H-like HicB family nuclease
MTREFTAVIEQKGRWYVAWVEEIPGVNTQGKTLAEARRNLKEALQLIFGTKSPSFKIIGRRPPRSAAASSFVKVRGIPSSTTHVKV